MHEQSTERATVLDSVDVSASLDSSCCEDLIPDQPHVAGVGLSEEIQIPRRARRQPLRQQTLPPRARIRSAPLGARWARRYGGLALHSGCFMAPPGSEWHNDGMARIRLSTTVDATLLENARSARSGVSDAVLVDEALAALLARHRAAEVDASYAAYDEHPLDEPDEWGDLASFRKAAAAS